MTNNTPVNTSAVEEFNDFIRKYCGENSAHLLDSDENDGQRFRDKLSMVSDSTLREVRDEMEMLRKMKGSSKSIAEAEFKSAYCQGVLDSEAIITKRLEK